MVSEGKLKFALDTVRRRYRVSAAITLEDTCCQFVIQDQDALFVRIRKPTPDPDPDPTHDLGVNLLTPQCVNVYNILNILI